MKEIAKKLGWSEPNLKQYSNLLNKIGYKVLEKCNLIECNAVSKKSYNVTFTEGWFRNSGLYDLSEDSQLIFFDKYKSDNFTWKPDKVKSETGVL